jgi:hypothetical protein
MPVFAPAAFAGMLPRPYAELRYPLARRSECDAVLRRRLGQAMTSQTPNQNKKPLILTQIAARLHDIFDGHIDLSDVSNKNDAEKENYFITRAYLALYLLDELRITPAEAGASITDGGADDGIDAVYVDKKNARVFFGQSKWRANMQKGVELNDFVRFRDGVKNVIALEWSDDNKNIQRFSSQIEQQLTNIDTNVIMVLAHTSEQEIAENIDSKIQSYLAESNKYQPDFMSFKQFTVTQAARIARSHTRPENINIPVMLAHFGVLQSPYKAVYGSVSAVDLVQWFDDHGNKLFAENLRYGIDKSDVNNGIISTAESDPDSFWYYNNGVTAICDEVVKQPIGGPDTKSGVFDVKRISIINGAQTISSLQKAKSSGTDLTKVRVHLRIISLADTPEGFAASVTSANNTQNDLNPVDFVAADPNQERIRKEAAQLGVTYTFRRGDQEPDKEHGFNVRSATVAAACASGDLKLAVASKRYISGLWENTKKEPYTRLFNDETSAEYLWNIVRIMNAVDSTLTSCGADLSGKERLTSVHGNRFILFYVFSKFNKGVLESTDEFDDLVKRAKKLTKSSLNSLITTIAAKFPEAYPGNIFKNQERQTELLDLIA